LKEKIKNKEGWGFNGVLLYDAQGPHMHYCTGL
jgi:hypothetical protein